MNMYVERVEISTSFKRRFISRVRKKKVELIQRNINLPDGPLKMKLVATKVLGSNLCFLAIW